MDVIPSIMILILAHMAQGYPYSSYGERRYNRASYNPAFVPMPASYNFNQQGYENQQQQQEALRAYRPYYYYPYRPDRNYEDVPETEINDEDYQSAYPYGQELWYEGGPDAMANAAAAATREAILQNLIIAQMYEDAAANAAVNGFPLYQPATADEYGRDFQYGVPTTDVDEKERAREFLIRNEADQEVKELESLRKAKEANKEGKRRRKQKNKERKAKENNARDVEVIKRGQSATTATPALLTENHLIKSADELSSMTLNGGQKEVVIPQPPRSRRPLGDLEQRLHARSEDPSVYQTIKKLLELERNHKTEGTRLQKRFISTEEQLTQQLNSLKRSAM